MCQKFPQVLRELTDGIFKASLSQINQCKICEITVQSSFFVWLDVFAGVGMTRCSQAIWLLTQDLIQKINSNTIGVHILQQSRNPVLLHNRRQRFCNSPNRLRRLKTLILQPSKTSSSNSVSNERAMSLHTEPQAALHSSPRRALRTQPPPQQQGSNSLW